MKRVLQSAGALVALIAYAVPVAADDDFGSSMRDRQQVTKSMHELATQYHLQPPSGPSRFGRIGFSSFHIGAASWESHEAIEVHVMDGAKTNAYLDDEEEWVRKEQQHRFNPQRQQVAGLTGLVLVPVKDASGYDKDSCYAYGIFRNMVLTAASAHGCPKAIALVSDMRDKLSPLTHQEDPRAPSSGQTAPQPGEMPLPPSLR